MNVGEALGEYAAELSLGELEAGIKWDESGNGDGRDGNVSLPMWKQPDSQMKFKRLISEKRRVNHMNYIHTQGHWIHTDKQWIL